METESTRKVLANLSRELGRPDRNFAILGEGNTSALLSRERFLVKASGTSLENITEKQLVEVRFEPILRMLDQDLDDEQITKHLEAATVAATDLRPSVETAFHAWLLTQPGIRFVGHTHPTSVNKVLCSEKASLFANKRLFPDEVVCCGPRSLLVEYSDPGTGLAMILRDAWNEFIRSHDHIPRVILVRNHGLIAVGATPGAVLSATLMASKAADIFVGASTLGGPVFMDTSEVTRIYSRTDEHYRQKQLDLI